MVHTSNGLHARQLLKGDFPPDRPAAPAWLTVPLSKLYGLGAAWDARRQPPERAFRPPVPVISVGNITAGGSGKTPFVIALARLLMELRPELDRPNALAILSRGYGRQNHGLVVVEAGQDYKRCGDEPLLIKEAVPSTAVLVHARRALAARVAVEKFGARLILLDDGFQHRRIARDLDLVLVDGQQPLGNGYLLPAGPLREPPEALARASWLVGVGPDGNAAADLAEKLGKPCLRAVPKLLIPPELEQPVFVLTGIARPHRVHRMLTEAGVRICGSREFEDHHPFTTAELAGVHDTAVRLGARTVLTTAKDRVRISRWPGELPLRVAGLELALEPPAEARSRLAKWCLTLDQPV